VLLGFFFALSCVDVSEHRKMLPLVTSLTPFEHKIRSFVVPDFSLARTADLVTVVVLLVALPNVNFAHPAKVLASSWAMVV
jgi:hypothetical protein